MNKKKINNKKKSDEIEFDFDKIKNFIKKKYPFIILGLFLIFGFYLRAYHIDYPAIGYHNMKEMDFFGEANNFLNGESLIHPIVYHWKAFEDPGYFEANAQMPFLGWLIALFWLVFGKSVFWGRLIIILFFMGNIIFTYLIAKKLSKNNEFLSLLSAFFITIMPLGVYFGRNVQPESPGLFFILLSTFFYLLWMEKNYDKKYLFISMAMMSISILFKMTHLIMLVPLLFISPLKKFLDVKFLKKQLPYAAMGLSIFLIGAFLLQLSYVGDTYASETKDVAKTFFSPLKKSYWDANYNILKSYVIDNFTGWFFLIGIIGLGLLVLKRKTLFSRFVFGNFFALILYLMLIPYKVNQHSYYQFIFLPLVSMSVAYFFYFLGSLSKQLFKFELTKLLPLLLILLFTSSITGAYNRVWDTQFFGQDVAGEYIKEHTNPDDRFLSLGWAQTTAVCFYAERRCGQGVINASELIEVEEKYNLKYIYIYGPMIGNFQQKEYWDYIQNNYEIVEIGIMTKDKKNWMPYYYILRKGGNFSTEGFDKIQPVYKTTYELKTQGELYFYTVTK